MTTKEDVLAETNVLQDEDEIDLDDDDDNDDNDNDNNDNDDSVQPIAKTNRNNNNQDNKEPQKQQQQAEEEEEEDNNNNDTNNNINNKQNTTNEPTTTETTTTTNTKKLTKSQLLRDRLRKLKMKTNQGRQLNRQEVMKEGERLGSEEGMNKEKKRLLAEQKKLKQSIQDQRNNKVINTLDDNSSNNNNNNSNNKIDPTKLTEQAYVNEQRVIYKKNKNEKNQYSVNDYYNPEGQYRNYESNLKSLPPTSSTGIGVRNSSTSNNSDTYNPIMAAVGTSAMNNNNNQHHEEKQRLGAKRLSNELKKRYEKQSVKRAKQKELEYNSTDVSYINERNKNFNKKISRNYDESTATIRQNLERGTAL